MTVLVKSVRAAPLQVNQSKNYQPEVLLRGSESGKTNIKDLSKGFNRVTAKVTQISSQKQTGIVTKSELQEVFQGKVKEDVEELDEDATEDVHKNYPLFQPDKMPQKSMVISLETATLAVAVILNTWTRNKV